MPRERKKGIGALGSFSLVPAFSLVVAAYPLGGWACESWISLTGEGEQGMFAVFFVLPAATAGARAAAGC